MPRDTLSAGRDTPEADPVADAASVRPLVVALVGNPNTGKTALFNALTGFRRHVANYAGVTVDIARGPIRGASRPIELLDLPGTYSLAAASPDEAILCDALQGRVKGAPRPAAILAIVDASNPLRNFYLVSQLLEAGLPVVIALNMVDIARARGIRIDARGLSQRLGVPVIPVTATKPLTTTPLIRALESASAGSAPAMRVEFPEALTREVAALRTGSVVPLSEGEALRLLAAHNVGEERGYLERGGEADGLRDARQRLKTAGLDSGPTEVRARYAWVNRVLDGLIERRLAPGKSWSNRLDRVLTHRLAGAAVLILALYLSFYSIYVLSGPLMAAVEGLFGWIGGGAAAVLPGGFARSLVVDGLIGGVGGVLAFLPQILILFLLIAILEDCGYLARAAFMVDRLMRPLGLSGRAFIPLLSSFACTVPAIMGTRAIADRRERLITILIAPFMSCSARLPIYVLLIGAFVPSTVWLGGVLRLDAVVMLAMYLVGVVFAIPVALLLRRTVLPGPPSAFLMELPSYKLPRARTIYQRVYLAGHGFVARAGTIILIVNLLVWALGYFPRSAATLDEVGRARAAAGWDDATYQRHLAGAYLGDSYLGRLGRTIEPAIRPLGWDWRIGVGVVASFPAREVIIATLGTLCNLGNEVGGESVSPRAAIRNMTRGDGDEPLFTLPVALSLMVFFALCAQCSATLVVIGKESGSWVWPAVSFFGMTTLAYVAALATSVCARAMTA